MNAASAVSARDRGRLVVRSAWRSHVGRVRLINEDRVFDDAGAGIWAVADGMGGHRGGDVAAQLVVEALRDACAGKVPDIRAALAAADAAIGAHNRNTRADAGATVVAARIVKDGLDIVWAGDSRAYRWADGCFHQLTRDHSLVQELIDADLLSPAMAERHPHSHIVTRALGIGTNASLDATYVQLPPDELPARFLLCSDGLSRSLDLAEPMGHASLDEVVERLLQRALARDGGDNISLVLIQVEGCD